jgi:hypothetical protein
MPREAGPVLALPTSPAPPNAVQRYGVRNESDAVNFLANEWLDKRGMGNCLLYGLGVWSNNATGSAAPSTANITINSTDSISGTVEASISPAEWRATGVLPNSTLLSPTLGNVWIVNQKGSGGEDRFSQRLFTEVLAANAESSTWKSYVDIGAMWIGDTIARRGVFNTSSVPDKPNTILGRGGLPLPSGLPFIPGTNTSYTETASGAPVPRAPL